MNSKSLKPSVFFTLASLMFLSTFSAKAAERYYSSQNQFPNVSGDVLLELKADRLTTENISGVSPNNIYMNIESNFSFNLNKNWSIKTAWDIYPTSITEGGVDYPERKRVFFGSQRGFNPDDTFLQIDELKLDFKSNDVRFFVGKYDPTFGKAYDKKKRIGVFGTDFAEDYELNGRIGAGIFALLDDTRVAVNTFFNDTTGLSGSINGPGTESRNNGLAGNTGTFSSYTITVDGKKFFGIRNLSYNVGYRSLGVDTSLDNRARETGYLGGTEYLIRTGYRTSITPYIEVARMRNFTGAQGRDALYTTVALIGKYSNWTASIANITRKIDEYEDLPEAKDRLLQLSASYKLKNDIVLGISRASIKEGGDVGVIYGALASYLYEF